MKIKRHCPKRRAARLLLATVLLGPAAHAQDVPDVVSPPKGINLGSTSFYDGFGRARPGWTWLQYARFEDLTRITDGTGNNPVFKGTSIEVFVAQTQLSYTSAWQPFGGDGTGVSALLPIAGFRTHFSTDSDVALTHDGFNIGDLNFGPFYQSKRYLRGRRPVLAWRVQLSVVAPTGGFDARRSINQGSGFWAFNPYVAFTWVPVRGLEFSSRLNYQYNFATCNIASPPPVPGLRYRNGEAGQIVFGNFDVSAAVGAHAELGLNGYALGQLTPDRTNGLVVAHSRVTELSAGPGARLVFNAANAVNVNLYLPVISHNATSGLQLNLQFVHRF